ncbi:MAG: hypothetical protein GX962_05640 [Epulopiscium sp.]|nr:hypothetical protein [Candidatus Epulonipiscium sp.]
MKVSKTRLDFGWRHSKRKVSLILIISVVFTYLFAFNTSAFAQTNLPRGYEKLAQSEALELYVNKDNGGIAVKDKRNDYIWKSIVDESMYPIDDLNKQWKNYVQSIFAINYIDMANRDTPPNRGFSSGEGTIIEVKTIKNGVEIEYNLEPIGISIALEFTLDEDQFVVRIPASKIKEVPIVKAGTGSTSKKETEIQYGLISVELLPFFGAATDEIDGYLLYPDGPGGLTLYSEVKNRPADVKVGKWKIYSNDKVDVQDLFGEEGSRYRAHLPIFGIKNEENAFLAAVTEGIEQTGITAYPSGYVVGINHMNFDFIYRYHYDLTMSNISIDNNTLGKVVARAEKNLNLIDKEIRFFMLYDEKANYSEMANVYRNYLLDQGLLKNRIPVDSKIPLSMTLFMGITEQQMLFNKFIPMTTVDQTTQILKTLKENQVDEITAILKGWQKGGYGQWPRNWPFDSKLGKKKQIENLNEYVKSNQIDLYLENCFDFARGQVGGFSARTDIVLDGSHLPVTSRYSKAYLLNPTVSAFRHQEFLKKIQAYHGFNVAYEDLGKVIYFDYHKEHPSQRHETVEKWQEILQTAQQDGRKTAVDGANQYVFADTDFIYNMPTKTFGYFITDREIPFLQMILYGSVPYSTENGNLSYDLQLQKLKWVEYGSSPTFELTSEQPLKLKNTNYNHLFTSSFDYWQDNVIEIYTEFNERLKGVYGNQMIQHQEIAPNLIEIKYSNGYQGFINYNDYPYHLQGIRIPAKDYVIVTDRGKIQ